MSGVISFRLDSGNPREAQAREVLRAWYAQGYSMRHILTEALLSLGESHRREQTATLALDEVNRTLHRSSRCWNTCRMEGARRPRIRMARNRA